MGGQACASAAFPRQVAVIDKNGTESYVDFKDVTGNREGRVKLKRMSPELKDELIAACEHVLFEEFRKALVLKVLGTPKGGRASDVNFRSWLCGPSQADVCNATDEELEEEDLQE